MYSVFDHGKAWPHVFSPSYKVLDFKDPKGKTLAFSLHFLDHSVKDRRNSAEKGKGHRDAAVGPGGSSSSDDPAEEAELGILDDDANWDDNGPELPWSPKVTFLF